MQPWAGWENEKREKVEIIIFREIKFPWNIPVIQYIYFCIKFQLRVPTGSLVGLDGDVFGWFESEAGTVIGYTTSETSDVCLVTGLAAVPSIGDSVNLDNSTSKSNRHFGVRIEFSFGKLSCVFPSRSSIYRQRGLASMQSIQALNSRFPFWPSVVP